MSGGIITRGEVYIEIVFKFHLSSSVFLYQFKNWIENLELLILNMKEQVVYN
jgi:hypothetical protein